MTAPDESRAPLRRMTAPQLAARCGQLARAARLGPGSTGARWAEALARGARELGRARTGRERLAAAERLALGLRGSGGAPARLRVIALRLARRVDSRGEP